MKPTAGGPATPTPGCPAARQWQPGCSGREAEIGLARSRSGQPPPC